MILLLLLLACRKPGEPPEVYVPGSSESAPSPAGQISGGVYQDQRFAVSVPLPEGWTGAVGAEPSPLRFTATHATTGAVVQLVTLPAGAGVPLARPGCSWTFVDVGRYRDLTVASDVTVATCTPKDPTGPRVFAVLTPRDGFTLDLGLSVPNTQLAAGRAAGQILLRGVRFEGPAAAPAP